MECKSITWKTWNPNKVASSKHKTPPIVCSPCRFINEKKICLVKNLIRKIYLNKTIVKKKSVVHERSLITHDLISQGLRKTRLETLKEHVKFCVDCPTRAHLDLISTVLAVSNDLLRRHRVSRRKLTFSVPI